MANVTFYQLQDADTLSAITDIIVGHFRSRKQIAVVCADRNAAEALDEHLWQLPTDAFIPHNLRGEGPPNGAPVMLIWSPVTEQTPIMINTGADALDNHARVQQIIEFVPADDEGKQAARERYKQYQRAGCQLQFKPISKETQNG